jgi:phage baseplate assembly protein W
MINRRVEIPSFFMSGIRLTKKDKSYVDISLSFEPNPVTGDLTLLKNERAINNAVKNIIMTVPGELVFNRNYGSSVSSYLFDFIDEGTAGLIDLEIRRSIGYNEPRVELIDVKVTPRIDQHDFSCRIEYKIVGSERTFIAEQILTATR